MNARGGYILGASHFSSKMCFSTKVSSGNSRLSAMTLRDRLANNPFQPHDHDIPEDGMQDIEVVVASKGIKLR